MSNLEDFIFLSSFIPTTAHINPDTVCASDLYPAKTFDLKKVFLEEAFEKKWANFNPNSAPPEPDTTSDPIPTDEKPTEVC